MEYGEWAQCEIEILSHFIRPGDVVVDAGAYIGTHTVAFSLMVGSRGRVHSFEPNHSACVLLAENASASAINNITIHEMALGDRSSKARLLAGEPQNIGSTRIQSAPKKTRKTVKKSSPRFMQLEKTQVC